MCIIFNGPNCCMLATFGPPPLIKWFHVSIVNFASISAKQLDWHGRFVVITITLAKYSPNKPFNILLNWRIDIFAHPMSQISICLKALTWLCELRMSIIKVFFLIKCASLSIPQMPSLTSLVSFHYKNRKIYNNGHTHHAIHNNYRIGLHVGRSHRVKIFLLWFVLITISTITSCPEKGHVNKPKLTVVWRRPSFW